MHVPVDERPVTLGGLDGPARKRATVVIGTTYYILSKVAHFEDILFDSALALGLHAVAQAWVLCAAETEAFAGLGPVFGQPFR